jgi:hypothetical protein
MEKVGLEQFGVVQRSSRPALCSGMGQGGFQEVIISG